MPRLKKAPRATPLQPMQLIVINKKISSQQSTVMPSPMRMLRLKSNSKLTLTKVRLAKPQVSRSWLSGSTLWMRASSSTLSNFKIRIKHGPGLAPNSLKAGSQVMSNCSSSTTIPTHIEISGLKIWPRLCSLERQILRPLAQGAKISSGVKACKKVI